MSDDLEDLILHLIDLHNSGHIFDLKFEADHESVHAYFKPAKPITYIVLDKIVCRSNLTFEEIIGSNNAIRD